MSFRVIVCTVAVFISTFASIAQANGLAIALKGGLPRIDVNLGFTGVNTDIDEETVFGVSVGYEINNNSTIELEFARGTAGFNASNSATSIFSDIEISTVGLYYVQRSDGDLYFMFKSGIVREDVSFSSSSAPDSVVDEVGFSWGLGGGYRLNGGLSIEAEYTQIEADVAWVLLSARYELGL